MVNVSWKRIRLDNVTLVEKMFLYREKERTYEI